MKPLEILYWLRVALGIAAAILCVAYGWATGTLSNTIFTFNIFLNGMTLAILTYIISYYLIKPRFLPKEPEKPQKIFTTGMGIYFLSWIVCWVLLYTIIVGPPV